MALTNILVPTDFGEAADHALDLAVTLAAKLESTVTVLHVFYLPPLAYADGLYLPIDDMLLGARRALDDTVLRAKRSYPKVESVLLSKGEPYQQILRVAHEQNIDLIVMGTHGRRGLSRVLMGSVAEKVVRLSPVPVLTVPGEAEPSAKDSQ